MSGYIIFDVHSADEFADILGFTGDIASGEQKTQLHNAEVI